jgi:RND family efflux transporter MFP subunit
MKLTPKRIIVLVLLALGLGLVYAGATHRFANLLPGDKKTAATSERKVLYWYDAMNPQNHFSQAGKAPDGMDLVPQYEEQKSAAAPALEKSAEERKILYWYDPMHPAYKSDKAGIAPDCGMALVPKYAEEDAAAKMPEGTITLSADKQAMAGVRTAIVERKQLTQEVRTNAQIVVDETRIAHIHVKVAGYIEQAYVDFIGQQIKKGQPLFTIYSPDLVSTEEEYLIAKRGDSTLKNAPFKEISSGSESLLQAAKRRLQLWDISEDQIRQLDESGKAIKNLTFYSPISGFVTDRKAFPHTSVTPDTELYTVTDMSSVWAEAEIYEYEVPFVHLGQAAEFTLSYYPGKTFRGKISFISPTVDPQTRTVMVRVQLPNPGFALKPQMFAEALIHVEYGTKVVIPQEAVLNSGTEAQVFVVHEGGVFEPRKVTLGPVLDGNVAVLTGLKAGEKIVVSGNFLIDSESRLKSATNGMAR